MNRSFICLAVLAIALVGCGGSGDGTTSATKSASLPAAAVKKCLEENALEMRFARLLAPKGSGVHVFYAIAPDQGHVGVVVTPDEATANRIAAKLARLHEFDAHRTVDGLSLILLDFKPTAEDEALGSKCAQD
jgi:hypothetical protein